MDQQTNESLSFFRSLYKGEELEPVNRFRGLKLKNDHISAEMICDCCSDDGCGDDDCCGFN